MVRPIKNEQQYEDALMRVYALLQKDLKPDSKDSNELEILSILVKEYFTLIPLPYISPLHFLSVTMTTGTHTWLPDPWYPSPRTWSTASGC